jgi:hypothetical protein
MQFIKSSLCTTATLGLKKVVVVQRLFLKLIQYCKGRDLAGRFSVVVVKTGLTVNAIYLFQLVHFFRRRRLRNTCDESSANATRRIFTRRKKESGKPRTPERRRLKQQLPEVEIPWYYFNSSLQITAVFSRCRICWYDDD